MNDLLERIKELPVFDTHEHFESYDEMHGYDWPQFLYNNSYLNVFASSLPNELIRVMDNPNESIEKHFKSLLEIAKLTEHTTNGRFLKKLVAICGSNKLNFDSFDQLNTYFNSRTVQSIQKKTPTIKATVVNTMGHPLYGYCRRIKDYFEKPPTLSKSIFMQLCVTPLHCIHGLSELTDLEYVYGKPISSLEDWEQAVQYIIKRSIDIGIVGFKDIYMYFRSFDIDMPDELTARTQFFELLKGQKAGKALLDTMLYKLYAIMSETGLTVSIHTGYSITTCESAFYMHSLIKLMKSYPKMRFDLLHLNYPKLEDYILALKSCPNAYANCTWITTLDQAYTMNFIRQAIDILTIDKVILFGGDRHCPGEPVACALDITLDILAQSLSALIKQSIITFDDALYIAEHWLYENPKKLHSKQ